MPVKKKTSRVKKAKPSKNKKAASKRRAVSKPNKAARVKPAKPIGVVTHFYTAIKVAIVKLKAPLKAGTTLCFRGATTDFSQKVESMQYDHVSIRVGKKGQQIGIKVKKRVREGDAVYVNS